MNGILVLGRIAFVAIFIFSGITKLIDINATADYIATKVVMPPILAGLVPAQLYTYLAQVEGATGMNVPQWQATLAGLIEVICGLMIAANIGTRLAAFVLILFTALTTYYFHDFWNLAGDARTDQIVHALKNLSIMGGLMILFALGRQHAVIARPSAQPQEIERF